MSNELVVGLRPNDVISESLGNPAGGIDDPFGYINVGLGKAIAFNPKATGTVFQLVRIPNAATLATGLTVTLVLADDVLNSVAGKNVYLGVTLGPVTSDATTFDENASSGAFVGTVEVLTAVTMPAANGSSPFLHVASIAVPVADMNALAAGGMAMLRIRRVGGNALDTGTSGRVGLCHIDVRNT